MEGIEKTLKKFVRLQAMCAVLAMALASGGALTVMAAGGAGPNSMWVAIAGFAMFCVAFVPGYASDAIDALLYHVEHGTFPLRNVEA